MFLEALYRRASDDPDGAAVLAMDRRVGNAELWSSATAYARRLGRAGLTRGEVVGIAVRDEYLNLVATLAAMHAGLVQVALPTFDPVAYRSAIAGRLGLSAVIVGEPGDALDDLAAIPIDGDVVSGATPSEPSAARPDDVCLFVATSGTTGRPKIIPLSQRQLYLQAINFQGVPRPEIVYRPTSIEFNSSRKQRLYCLAYGGTNVLADASRHAIAETCRRFGVTELGLSPAQAKGLLDGASSDTALPTGIALRLVGSPVGQRVRREIMERLSPRLFVGYGASEFGAIATAGPSHHDLHPATVGMVHGGVELEIVDESHRAVPASVTGRIRLKSAGMATRYHDDEAATAAAFRGGWFYPGDVGHRGEAGDLRFDGRSDDMMVLASMNIFPAEIEKVVEGLPGVVECAAFSVKSAEFGDVPLVAVVSDGSADAAALLTAARKALGLRAPRKVILVDAVPRNPAGKVERNTLQLLAGKPANRIV